MPRQPGPADGWGGWSASAAEQSSALVPGLLVRRALAHGHRTHPDEVVEVDHYRLLRGSRDHHDGFGVQVRLLLGVRDPRRNVDVVARRRLQPGLLVAVEEDELGMALHDVDPGLGPA